MSGIVARAVADVDAVAAAAVAAAAAVVEVVAWRRGCCAGAGWRCVAGTSSVWPPALPVWRSFAHCTNRKTRSWPPVACTNPEMISIERDLSSVSNRIKAFYVYITI